MPIRFRCAYCNQLMGIARRKSGTVVRCPTCTGQVVVPGPEADEPDPGEKSPPPQGPNVFERSDFDEVLRPGVPNHHAGTVAADQGKDEPSGAWGTHAEPLPPMERVDAVAVAAPARASSRTPTSAGIVLSTKHLTLLAIAAALILGLVFAGGVLVGKFAL